MLNPWLKYSGMAMQFVAFLLAGYWIGGFAGDFFGWKKGSGELTGMLFFLLTGLIKLIRDLLNNKS